MIEKRCDVCGRHGARVSVGLDSQWHDLCEECYYAVEELLIKRGAMDSYEYSKHKEGE